MGFNDEREGLNLPQSRLSEFFDDIDGRLSLLTGKINPEEFGLTLEAIRKPVLVVGDPGIGKTCGIISCIKELNKTLPEEKKLGFKKILLGQTVVGSLQGIPVVKPDGGVVRVQIPDLPDPERDGEYGVLFLDEITTADEMQIQPALGLCDDSRCLGEYTLPEHWIVVAAGNGPNCTNFVRLDDMTLTRFVGYDIAYDYKKDFRPYAHKSGLHEDIIAFLNFSPDACVRVESTDMDSAGKMFPCPRTWERLSNEIKMMQARGRELDADQMVHFAGRIVGVKAGREFGAFMQYKTKVAYDAEKILQGKEKDPEVGMPKEIYHIIMQHLFKVASQELKAYEGKQIPADKLPRYGNMFSWILKFKELENILNAIFEMRNELPMLANLMLDEDFCEEYCPELNVFFTEHGELISGSLVELENLKF